MEENIARMMNRLSRKSQNYIGSALRKFDLTAAEQPFFMVLQKHEGITQEELTAYVCVDKAMTTRVVRSLEGKGYLRREQDKQDRRQNLLYPTEKAKKIGEDVRGELLHFNELLTEGLDTERVRAVYQALCQMEKNFEHMPLGKGGETGAGHPWDR